MLTIVVHGDEYFDEATQEFLTQGDVTVDLEHSLVSLSKWESITEKPFLVAGEKTTEEIYEYIKCMCLTPNIAPEIFSRLSQTNLEQVNNYIEAKMTATWFFEPKAGPKSTEVVTSELIYYWLVTFNIPFECETWHLNRLFTLIKVCNLKNGKPKKMSRSDAVAMQRELNARRKAQLGTTG
jgi:hypothetical protein